MNLSDFIDWSIDLLRNSQRGDLIFYEYAKTKLDEWTNQLKMVNKSDLRSCIKDETTTAIGIKSFYNLINHIIGKSLEILRRTYQGDYYESIVLLRKLFYKQSSMQYKLNDRYINYFKFTLVKDVHQKFFRVVDFNKDYTPTNCNHVPFTKRNLAKHGRFNLYGFPCLYLSENIHNCCKEVGDVVNKHTRYFSEFTHVKQTFYLNLTLPNKNTALTVYDKFCFIITYPILFLCLSPTSGDSPFEEEYLFPQLLLPSLFLTYKFDHVSHVGIAYNSTKDFRTLNLVIPAKLNENEVIPNNNISEFILSKFNEIGPFLVESN